MITIIKANINITKKNKYFLFNEKISKLFVLLLPDLLTPKGVPHELQTNLPDNARSALILELPQTKHSFEVITLIN